MEAILSEERLVLRVLATGTIMADILAVELARIADPGAALRYAPATLTL